jgi:hypothetical protein
MSEAIPALLSMMQAPTLIPRSDLQMNRQVLARMPHPYGRGGWHDVRHSFENSPDVSLGAGMQGMNVADVVCVQSDEDEDEDDDDDDDESESESEEDEKDDGEVGLQRDIDEEDQEDARKCTSSQVRFHYLLSRSVSGVVHAHNVNCRVRLVARFQRKEPCPIPVCEVALTDVKGVVICRTCTWKKARAMAVATATAMEELIKGCCALSSKRII